MPKTVDTLITPMRKMRYMQSDLNAKRPPIGRTALKARVRSLVQSAKAKAVAKNYMMSLRKVCSQVLKNKGTNTGG